MARHFTILFLLLVMMGGCASGRHAVEAGPFPETIDELADIGAARLTAKEEGKLLLVVLGANWCHDSKALMAVLDEPATAAMVDASYERVLINVEDFARGFETAELFGLPIYAHTPTLLIVEPESGVLINWDDHYIFRDAYKLEPEEIAAYMDEHKSVDVMLPQPEEGRAPIDGWAVDAAGRIRQGYRQIAAYEEFEGDAFEADWKALRGLRYGFSEDYPALLLQLSETGEVGELPVYDKLPWE